uniref:Fibronectin type-III domain-containing protein n=1 Tax=Amphimedon queenslandica TaxID=400682 RepID=A0A1X7TF08_AMPQE
GDVTGFQCTNGSVYAGDRVECNCTTNTGAIDWNISYRVLGSCNQSWIPVTEVKLHRSRNSAEKYGYNFTYNKSNNSSMLTFHLNASESINVMCKNGNVHDNRTTNITDSGCYAKAPTNLTATFNASGVTLEWEDTENNCTSTEYNVTIYDSTSTGVLTYCTNKTTIFINSSELNTAEVYTYTVRGWNGQQSNISNPFTLGCINVINVTIINVNTTNATDPCKNDSCCADVTLNIILELSESDTSLKYPIQNYSISYHSITENIPVTYKFRATVLMPGVVLKYNEAYCLTVTPMNNFSTGEPKNVSITIDEYPCPSSENTENGGLIMLLNTVALLLGVELILLYSGLADGVITNFQCTDGPVCAGDSIECRCTTDTGTLEWFISYSLVEPLKWNLIPVVSFFRNKTESEGYYGYNFTFNTTYTGLNTSILTFNLNHSESVLIECANGEVIHKMNTTVTDL